MSETITAGKSSSFYLNAGNALTMLARLQQPEPEPALSPKGDD